MRRWIHSGGALKSLKREPWITIGVENGDSADQAALSSVQSRNSIRSFAGVPGGSPLLFPGHLWGLVGFLQTSSPLTSESISSPRCSQSPLDLRAPLSSSSTAWAVGWRGDRVSINRGNRSIPSIPRQAACDVSNSPFHICHSSGATRCAGPLWPDASCKLGSTPNPDQASGGPPDCIE